ncbi:MULTISPECIES: cupredoxin domain-containing protein [Paraburkholderia]|uniref:hypothetical protein n=1 Tax=Paraburkholderia TaxID=1822464 RepID=UPI0038BCCC73
MSNDCTPLLKLRLDLRNETPAPRITRRAISHTGMLAVTVEENAMFSSPRTAVFLGVAALGLVCSPGYAVETIKATLLMNAIQLDANHVKAGTVTFEVSNAPDTGLKHELVVLKTDVAADKLPVKNGQVPESQFKKIGEVEDIAPGKNKRVTFKLAPGRYVLICNQPGHYSMGLHTSLLVTP